MPHFVYKLIPPRSTFPKDITPAEGKLMQEHSAYWSGLMSHGCVLVLGPVMDPKGVWGLGVLETEDETDARALIANDPAIRANAGFGFELHSIQAMVRK